MKPCLPEGPLPENAQAPSIPAVQGTSAMSDVTVVVDHQGPSRSRHRIATPIAPRRVQSLQLYLDQCHIALIVGAVINFTLVCSWPGVMVSHGYATREPHEGPQRHKPESGLAGIARLATVTLIGGLVAVIQDQW
jgi:hypothetical protein